MNVYFIYAEEVDLVKIGKSVDVSKRILSLQLANPFVLRILFVIKCASSSESHALEKHLHTRFRHTLFRSEWFRNSNELKEFIANRPTAADVLAGAFTEEVVKPIKKATTAMPFSEFIRLRGATNCAKSFGVSLRTVYYWQERKTRPHRRVTERIMKISGLPLSSFYP